MPLQRTTPTACLTLLLATLAGCHSYPTSGIPDPASPPTRLNAGPVAVSATPTYNADESEQVFYYNLLKQGYLPVLLTIHNDGPEPVELLRARLRLTSPSGEPFEPIPPATVADSFGRNALAEGILLFGPFSYSDAEKFNHDLTRDWKDKSALEVETITPDHPLNKYVFFKINDAPIHGLTLTVPLDSTTSRRRDTFQIRF